MPRIASTTGNNLSVSKLRNRFYLQSLNQLINFGSLRWNTTAGRNDDRVAGLNANSASALIPLAAPIGTTFTIEAKLRQPELNQTNASSRPFGVENENYGVGAVYGLYSGTFGVTGQTGVAFHNISAVTYSGLGNTYVSSSWVTMALVLNGTAFDYYITDPNNLGTMIRFITGTLSAGVISPTEYTQIWIGRPSIPNNVPTIRYPGNFESLRVSNIVRYSGESVAEPENLTVDEDTVDLITVVRI